MSKKFLRIQMILLLCLFAWVSTMTTGCAVIGYQGFRNGSNPADFVVINAKIFTSDAANPWAEAVAIKNERIVYVGEDQGASDVIGPNTRVVNADGRMVTPGFIDNHCHVLWMGAMMSMMADLYEARDFNEFKAGVIKYGKENPKNPFVMAFGWRPEYLPNPVPTARMADAIINDRPLILWGAIGHIGWVNTKAAEIMEARNPQAFKELTPERDQHGKPTGMFHHFYAFNPFDYFTPEEFGPDMKKRMFARMSGTLRDALKVGVTTMNDVQIYKTFLPSLLEFQRSGGLREARVRGSYYISHYAHTDFEGLKKDLALWKALGPKPNDGHLVLGDSVKIYIDGVSANRTTFMLSPYSNAPPGEVGYALWTQDQFNRLMEIIDSLELQAATHACGDAGIRRVINGYEYATQKSGRKGARHRIEHMPLPHPDDWPRLASLGIHGAMQPVHFFGDKKHEEVMGPERMQRTMPWKRLQKAGVDFSFGSDWCAAPINPIYGLIVAGTRINYKGKRDWSPEDALDTEESVKRYTIDSARGLLMDKDLGSIKVGKYGDLVMFNINVMKVASLWFLLTHDLKIGKLDDFVDMTVVGGRIVYHKPDAGL